MARTDAKTDDAAATIATLEATNSELGEQLNAAQDELAARDATIATLTAAAEQSARDLATLQRQYDERGQSSFEAHKTIETLRAERDEAVRARVVHVSENERLRRLLDEAESRPSGAPLSLDLAALVDLARLAPDEPRYLAGARRLGDRLAAQILDDHD